MERLDNGPVMFVYPSEILSEYTEAAGEKLSPEAHRWAALFDEMASAFDRKGREDRKVGRPAAEWECFLAWSIKQFGRHDAGEIAELMQDCYMDEYNSGLSRGAKPLCGGF